ncbi:MAG: DUF6458 family protein [Solirubrobacterales bacterium]
MNFGISIFLIAVGAILAFAVNLSVRGIDLDVVGWILMAVGAVGLLLALLVYGRRGRTAYPDEVVPRREPPPY